MPQIITSIVKAIVNAVPQVLQAAMKLFTSFITAIPKIIPQIVAQLPKIIKSIVSGLANGIGDMAKVGLQLVQGLWNGINDAVGWVLNKIKGFGKQILDGIKSFFGIKSPSKVMESIVGKNLALGIGEGFMDNMKDVNKDIESAIKPLTAERHFKIGGEIEAPVAVGTSGRSVAPINSGNQSIDNLAAALTKNNNTRLVLKVDKKTLGEITVEGINDITKLTGVIPLAIM